MTQSYATRLICSAYYMWHDSFTASLICDMTHLQHLCHMTRLIYSAYDIWFDPFEMTWPIWHDMTDLQRLWNSTQINSIRSRPQRRARRKSIRANGDIWFGERRHLIFPLSALNGGRDAIDRRKEDQWHETWLTSSAYAMCHDSFTLMICDVTHVRSWYVTWLIHTRDMTHSHMWHDSFTHVTWLIRTCDMTHPQRLWSVT